MTLATNQDMESLLLCEQGQGSSKDRSDEKQDKFSSFQPPYFNLTEFQNIFKAYMQIQQQQLATEDTDVLDEIREQMMELNKFASSKENAAFMATQPLKKKRDTLKFVRTAVAAGAITQRSQLSGFTSNSFNSEGAQIIDYLYSESSGTDRAAILRHQKLRLLRKSIDFRKPTRLDSLKALNNVIDMLSDDKDSQNETVVYDKQEDQKQRGSGLGSGLGRESPNTINQSSSRLKMQKIDDYSSGDCESAEESDNAEVQNVDNSSDDKQMNNQDQQCRIIFNEAIKGQIGKLHLKD